MNDIEIESNEEHKANTAHRPPRKANRKICIEAFDLEDTDIINDSDRVSSK